MTESGMPEDCPHLTIYFDGDVTVAELIDLRLADPDMLEFQERILLILAEHEHPKVVIDLRHVTAVSSAMVASLLRLRKKVIDKLGRMGLCGVPPSLMNILQFIRLTEIFKIYPSCQEAIEVVRTASQTKAPARGDRGREYVPDPQAPTPQQRPQEQQEAAARSDEEGHGTT
jgi:anti-anti-sigma factor